MRFGKRDKTDTSSEPAKFVVPGLLSNKKKLLILAGVLLLAAGVLGYYFLQYKPSRKSTYLEGVPEVVGDFTEEEELGLQSLDHDTSDKTQSQDSKEAFEQLIKDAEAEERKNGIDPETGKQIEGGDGSETDDGGSNNNGGGGNNNGGGGGSESQDTNQPTRSTIIRIELGDHCLWVKDYDCAIDAYKTVIRRHPSNVTVMVNLARAYQRQGDLASAKQQIKNAQEVVDALGDKDRDIKAGLQKMIDHASSEINA